MQLKISKKNIDIALIKHGLVLLKRQAERCGIAVGIGVSVEYTQARRSCRHLLAPNREVTERLETPQSGPPRKNYELSSLNYDSPLRKVSSVTP